MIKYLNLSKKYIEFYLNSQDFQEEAKLRSAMKRFCCNLGTMNSKNVYHKWIYDNGVFFQ